MKNSGDFQGNNLTEIYIKLFFGKTTSTSGQVAIWIRSQLLWKCWSDVSEKSLPFFPSKVAFLQKWGRKKINQQHFPFFAIVFALKGKDFSGWYFLLDEVQVLEWIWTGCRMHCICFQGSMSCLQMPPTTNDRSREVDMVVQSHPSPAATTGVFSWHRGSPRAASAPLQLQAANDGVQSLAGDSDNHSWLSSSCTYSLPICHVPCWPGAGTRRRNPLHAAAAVLICWEWAREETMGTPASCAWSLPVSPTSLGAPATPLLMFWRVGSSTHFTKWWIHPCLQLAISVAKSDGELQIWW